MTAPRAERGFVLVGAVMVVLALTILGLSLFSLSSYENQFLRASVDQQRAFYAASGGLERVKLNLASGGRLEHSWFGFPDATVDSARAWQWKAGVMVESGPIEPGIVHVRVHARSGASRSTVSGRFLLSTVSSTYRRLFTLSNGITVQDNNQTINLDGKIYHRNTTSTWESRVTWMNQASKDSVRRGCTWIEDPDVQSIFDLRPQATLRDPPLVLRGTLPGAVANWHFDAQDLQPGWFRAPTDTVSSKFPFSFMYLGSNDPPLATPFTLRVRGPAVWVLPNGFYGFAEVTVDTLGDGRDAALVILAGPNRLPGDWSDLSVRFENGIHNPRNIPIILVSSRRVDLYGNSSSDRTLSYLSLYARDLRLEGKTNYKFFLRHPMNSTHDQAGGLIDRLIAWGALPNAGATTSGQLQLIAGSWQETRN